MAQGGLGAGMRKEEQKTAVVPGMGGRRSLGPRASRRTGVFVCGGFDLFFRFVQRQGLVSSTLCFDGRGLQVYVPWYSSADVLSAVAKSRYKQRVVFAAFKTLCGRL